MIRLGESTIAVQQAVSNFEYEITNEQLANDLGKDRLKDIEIGTVLSGFDNADRAPDTLVIEQYSPARIERDRKAQSVGYHSNALAVASETVARVAGKVVEISNKHRTLVKQAALLSQEIEKTRLDQIDAERELQEVLKVRSAA